MTTSTSKPRGAEPEPSAPIRRWLSEPASAEVDAALSRLARTPGVQAIAVMPDAHLAHTVCVGTVVATDGLILPQAVGGDIGCGMAAMAFAGRAERLGRARIAERLLDGLYEVTPIMRQSRERIHELADHLDPGALSDPALAAVARRDGRVQLGTLGRGNHFLEFQEDDEGKLWLMVHSGSRAMGQAITSHHLTHCRTTATGLAALDASSDRGRNYLKDMAWAINYARESRRLMAQAAAELVEGVVGCGVVEGSYFDSNHNHVRTEVHAGALVYVHRKGANAAHEGIPGIIPGSMGTLSYHVEGRGHTDALCSSSHGAGRTMDRGRAHRAFSKKELFRQLQGIWFDPRVAEHLRDEAPGAYKDIQVIMRTQADLVRIVRRLQPILSFKGT